MGSWLIGYTAQEVLVGGACFSCVCVCCVWCLPACVSIGAAAGFGAGYPWAGRFPCCFRAPCSQRTDRWVHGGRWGGEESLACMWACLCGRVCGVVACMPRCAVFASMRGVWSMMPACVVRECMLMCMCRGRLVVMLAFTCIQRLAQLPRGHSFCCGHVGGASPLQPDLTLLLLLSQLPML